MAAFAALQELKGKVKDDVWTAFIIFVDFLQILIVSRDTFHPYFRPPLSKELWYEDDPDVGSNLTYHDGGKQKKITLMPPEDYKDNLMFLSGTAVVVRNPFLTSTYLTRILPLTRKYWY